MEAGSPKKSKLLPESAYRELEEGETYEPVVGPEKRTREVTPRSIGIGLVMVVIFTFAAAYIGLKTGNVIEAAIPIVILAVFIGKAFKPTNTLLENVIIQSVGQASGVIVAGAVFTIPALYINQLQPNLLHIFMACCLGGFLGVVLIIPLRRYFVSQEHGKLPFPEATAINEILVSGEETSGSGGKVLLTAFGVGAAYDLFVETVHLWNQHLNSKVLLASAGKWLSDLRIEWKLDASAALFGLGYIIGIKYAAIIAAGSVLSQLVMIPVVFHFGAGLDRPLLEGHDLIGNMGAADVFALYVRPIGIGAIAMAGFIGIIKMGRIIVGSISLAFKGGSRETGEKVVRTDWDLKPRTMILIQAACVLAMAVFFWFLSRDLKIAFLGTLIAYVLVFLFTPVAARAIAIVGVNPVSGMTLITLIIACVSLAAIGLSEGAVGQSVALLIGCTVCTALSTSGAFISDLKIGYWLGATPREQQRWKFLGIVVAALSVGVVIMILAKAYGFTIVNEAGQRVANPNLPAPQGNLMAAIVTALLGGENQPYLLYALGGLVALMLEMIKVPALAFALGMYLPIQINMAVLAGGLASHVIGRTGGSKEERAARRGQGTLIASGLLAGAAIIGVIGATLRIIPVGEKSIAAFLDLRGVSDAFTHAYYEGFGGQLVSVLMFIGLVLVTYVIARWGGRKELGASKDSSGADPSR
jgi:putative OPT family oligopeptide transporter